jgi:hypothetical protein
MAASRRGERTSPLSRASPCGRTVERGAVGDEDRSSFLEGFSEWPGESGSFDEPCRAGVRMLFSWLCILLRRPQSAAAPDRLPQRLLYAVIPLIVPEPFPRRARERELAALNAKVDEKPARK